MALLVTRTAKDMLLPLDDVDGELFEENHIFEPEFHQKIYVEPCQRLKAAAGSFQVGDKSLLKQRINRGIHASRTFTGG